VAIDRVLAELEFALDQKTNFIILSDHGFGPVHKALYLNNLLEDQGVLKRKIRLKARSHEKDKQEITKETPTQPRNNLITLIQRLLNRVRHPFRTRLKPKKILINTVFKDFKNMDWSKTKAWLQYTHGIVINLRERQPLGIVQTGEEYEELRSYITKMLYNVTDPEHEKTVIEKIHRREDIYNGPYMKDYPDLIIEPKAGYLLQTQFNESLFGKLKISGHHRSNGIFISYGQDIREGHKIKNAEIIDIAPTGWRNSHDNIR
jgi:predicted AlkP superfamily phosphohydrolase/phosphomutase